MKIKSFAVGNAEEAYIEHSLSDGFNIISSDDNNKGKTIAIQSLMFALGNQPTFPVSFDYEKYYYYVEFEHENVNYKLCRKDNSFVLKHDNSLMIFDAVSELKRYWTKQIFHFPVIVKDDALKIVDPYLFYQLFFVGQDKKDTSNISQPGLYNKQDFYNMLFDICDAGGVELNEDEIKKTKREITSLQNELNVLLKQHKILQSSNSSVSYLSAANDRIAFARKVEDIEKIRQKIEGLRKNRNTALTRKAKWETTLKELRSLNRTIDCGELRCMDCNSSNISFKTSKQGGYSFDVSTTAMRTEIIASIADQISTYDEEIDRITAEINTYQQEFNSLLNDDNITLEAIVAFRKDVFDASEAETKIGIINARLSTLNAKLKSATTDTQVKKTKRIDVINQIVTIMQETYKKIDSTGNLSFNDIFTKRDEVYSGSEATIFHIVKLYALCKVLQHNYPIIIDSFRAEDLSTTKEDTVINLFKELDNQIIFTTTLKTEEMGKYDKISGITHVNYAPHNASKMLSPNYLEEFKLLLRSISVDTLL